MRHGGCLSANVHNIGQDSGYSRLPVELFRTERGFFAFDARRVTFLEIDRVVFDLLEHLRVADPDLAELKKSLPQHSGRDVGEARKCLKRIQEKGYLVPYPFSRCSPYEEANYRENLSSRLSGLTLFITTRCNLACSYCIYGGQYSRYPGLSQTPMSWETARNALDFLIRNSSCSRRVELDFFGGEPLLAFEMIRRCLAYLEGFLRADGREVVSTIASNGTIMSARIAEFLISKHVHIQFSLDGGRESHDRNRQFRGSCRGSFDLVFRNLEFLAQRDPDYFRKCVHIKGVLTADTIGQGDDSFFGHPLVRTVAGEGNLALLVKETQYDLAEDAQYFDLLREMGRALLEMSGVRTLSQLLAPLNFKQRFFFDLTFGQFTDVQAVNKFYFGASDQVRFLKSCLMGYGPAAVSPNGDISICHKATSFVIGNVNEGRWYFDRIMEFDARLYEDWPQCASCFAQRFCDLCFEKLQGNANAWNDSRSRFCEFTRRKFRTIFDYMLRILERNPKLWKDLDRMVRRSMNAKLRGLCADAHH